MKKKLIKLLVATFLFINIAGVAPVAFAEEITNFPNTEEIFESTEQIDVSIDETVEVVSSDDDTTVYKVSAEELEINNDTFEMVVCFLQEKNTVLYQNFE
jgi:hypothetical protein